MKKYILLILLSPFLLFAQSDIRLQVLGSGGPESGDKRASSSYLLWIDSKSKILIDFGGGASLRFEEVGAKIKDLEIILLTHLHADHTADLPALIKSSFFTRASGTVELFGPDKNKFMPSTETFIQRLFDKDDGAWQYLGDHLDGRAKVQLKTHTITKSKKELVIYKKDDIKITTVSVHHGPIPAIAYRIDIGGRSITFSGDMNGDYHTLEKLAFKTDLLVMHNAVPKNAQGVAIQLHMTPFIIGNIAKKADAKSLIISHRMLRTLGKEKETLSDIQKNYQGMVKYANDTDSYKVN